MRGWLVAVCTVVGVGLTSCSTSTGGGFPLPNTISNAKAGVRLAFSGTGGPTIPFGERNAAMEAVAKEFISLPHKDPKDDLHTLASYMTTLKVFAKSGVSPSGVWGTFTDGRLFVLSINPGAPPAKTHVAEVAAKAVTTSTAVRPGAEFPPRGGIARVLYDNASPDFPSGLSDAIATALRHTGYQNATALPGTVENFRSLRNVSMLFLETHGANGYTANGHQYYTLQTSTPQSQQNDAAYADDLKNHRLGYELAMVLPGGHAGTIHKFGLYFVTEDFFAKYVTFAPGGNDLMYVSACQGASSSPGAQEFIRTLEQMGLAYYVGWTKDTFIQDMSESEAFFVDRTLGEQNQQDLFGYTKHPPGTQPQAPYPAQIVYDAMGTVKRSDGLNGSLQESGNDANIGWGYKYLDKQNGAMPPYGDPLSQLSLVALKSAVTPLLLAPAIYQMNVVEPYQNANGAQAQLYIEGSFGSKPGSVTIAPAGGPAHVLSGAKWTPGEITVPIASSGLNAAGFVTVIGSTGIPSNEVPITMWTGRVVVTDVISVNGISGAVAVSGSGKFTSSATFNVQFRADVHPFRPVIEATPAPASLWFASVMASSTGSVTQVNGSFTGSQTIGSTTTTYTLTYAPPPKLPIALTPVSTGSVKRVFAFGSFAADGLSPQGCSRAMDDGSGFPLCLGISANVNDAASCKDSPKNTLCGATSGYGSPFSFGYSVLGYIERVGQIMMTMNRATYQVSVPKLTFPDSYNQSDWPNTFSGSGGTVVTFSFNPPVSPPTTTTPAIVGSNEMENPR